MAKEKVNKSQAVREYLKANRKATNQEVADALAKKDIKITANYVASIKTKIKAKRHARKAAATAPLAATSLAPAAAPTVVEKPAKPGDVITLDQIKKVAETVRAIGGFARLTELLGVIKEVGGPKKFRDLLEAMAATETDAIPF